MTKDPSLPDPRTLVVKLRPLTPSETFVTAHVEQLSGHALFYAPPLPRGLRRYARAAMLRIGQEHLIQGWGRALHEAKPHVVLAEYGPTGVAVLRACERRGTPLVVYFHGYDATHRGVVTQMRTRYVKLFRYASAIVAASAGIVEELRQMGAPEERLHHVPCGVDVSQFEGARPDEAPQTVVAVGRLVEKKAPLETIRAFGLARQSHPDARLIIIGEGPLRAACHQLIAELGLGDHVVLLGAQDHDVVVREMRAARLFAQHSVRASSGDTEGTPVAVTEAQACGLPVVATRHGGIPDIVAHGSSGFLVEEHDHVGMAEAMAALLADGALARRLGAVGRARVERRFDQRQTTKALDTILRNARLTI